MPQDLQLPSVNQQQNQNKNLEALDFDIAW